jgi:hypothetical protein
MQDGKALSDDKVKQTTILFTRDSFRFPEMAEYATSRQGTITVAVDSSSIKFVRRLERR